MSILCIFLSIIFLVLAAIHVYWALGSEWAFESILPTKETGERLFTPRRIESAIVGIGLLAIAFYYTFKGSIIQIDIPIWIYKYIGWIIPAIFMIRAIGDFKYCGIFKKLKATQFGEMDTKLFVPICLLISLLGFLVQLYS